MSDSPTPSLNAYTIGQRRRAEALIFARALFPLASSEQVARLARWIATGEWS